MIYEFIATIAAGFGMAGIALIIRHLSKLMGKPAPKWLIPIFAGLECLISNLSRIHWQDQQLSTRGDNLKVVKLVEGEIWYRPWSYVRPQVVRMMAVDEGKVLSTQPTIKQVNLYLFERRVSTKIVPQLVDCDTPAMVSNPALANQADKLTGAELQAMLRQANWQPLKTDDELVKVVCDD